MANARVAGEPRVWDARHQLSAGARAALEAQLTAAERRTGVPFFLLLTDRLHGQTVTELGRDAFVEHGLSNDPTQNPVLLVVAVDSGAAAVETGKGSAGIVPEIDARRIVKDLTAHLSSRHPERAISHALTQLAASARATAARRTPLPSPPREPDDAGADTQRTEIAGEDPADAGTSVDGDAGSAGTTSAPDRPDGGQDAGAAAKPGGGTSGRWGRSRLPIAVGVGALVLLGLGLRRRRQIAASRPGTEGDSAGKRPRPRF